ncbi:MAG: 1-deoxy-D-xylulose-5-phosphate synthase [Candidatus Limivicinus sp.]|nr:1-deoxy-D-xylulose-5-phosphate synthase [Candidatus Limivicinus sp.]
MSIIERINCSNDVKSLTRDELDALCRELREFEIESIARTGGHLASNLGTVELTVALHRVYDTSVDRLVFDVGHQSYTHKIITGRRDAFRTLRQYGGLSGFPKPYEAVDDAFIAGHASNSVSVALGMARARTLNQEQYDVVAVIGDGALTGGLAYEGLADAAASDEPLVIILNDNNMSISENVGGMSRLLQMMRMRPGYISFKKWYRAAVKKLPIIYTATHKLKEWLKSWMLPDNIFSEMGLNYLGPIDGHDLATLEKAIRLARDMECPVLLHVITRKGKGCDYAESHPDKYHGVGCFDAKTGVVAPVECSFSDKMGESLCRYAEGDSRIVAITAAMAGGTGIECFSAKYPTRFFDTGIAEGHATAMAAGMAKQGLIPVFAVYSSFLQRGYDMLIHDVSLQHLHTVFCVDRAGLVGSDGETHHGVFDVNYLSSVPGMTILAPASFQELDDMLGYALHELTGPVALRYPRGGEGAYKASHVTAEYVLREGTDLTLICYGTMVNEAMAAAEELDAKGISAEVIKLGVLCPNDFSLCLASLKKTGRLLIAEEVCAAGCVGVRIVTAAAMNGVYLKGARLLNLGSGIVGHGKVSELMREKTIDAAGICDAATALCAATVEEK